MFRLPDAIAPYISLIKWALIGVIASSLFIGGCRHGQSKSIEKLAKKDSTIEAITKSLNGAAAVFKRIEKAASDRIKADAQSRAAAIKAGEVAAAEKLAMEKRIAGFARELEKAKRKPKCKALLETDLEAICEL